MKGSLCVRFRPVALALFPTVQDPVLDRTTSLLDLCHERRLLLLIQSWQPLRGKRGESRRQFFPNSSAASNRVFRASFGCCRKGHMWERFSRSRWRPVTNAYGQTSEPQRGRSGRSRRKTQPLDPWSNTVAP